MGKCESVQYSNVNNQYKHTHTFFEMKNPNTTTVQLSPTHIRMQIYLIPIFILVHCLSHSLGVLHSEVCAGGDGFFFFLTAALYCLTGSERYNYIFLDSAMLLTSVDNYFVWSSTLNGLDFVLIGICNYIWSDFRTRRKTTFRRWRWMTKLDNVVNCGFFVEMNQSKMSTGLLDSVRFCSISNCNPNMFPLKMRSKTSKSFW